MNLYTEKQDIRHKLDTMKRKVETVAEECEDLVKMNEILKPGLHAADQALCHVDYADVAESD